MKNKNKNEKISIFKSKPFFTKIDNIDYKFTSKYIFYIFMMCVLSIAFSLLAGFGFSISNDIKFTLRAISMFCIF